MPILRGSLQATISFEGAPSPPVFLRLLGSSSPPSSSRPHFLPQDLPTPCYLCWERCHHVYWDLLSVLLLEIGKEFSHLVGTPTSFRKSFLQGSRKPMVDKESCEGFSCGHMGWTCWQGEVNLFLHAFRCPRSLHLLRVIFIQTLIRRVLQYHLLVRPSPWLRVLLRVALSSSSSHC